MDTYFLIGRWLWLGGAVTFAMSVIVWMVGHRENALWGIAILIWPLHGVLYFSIYLMAYYHTFDLPFDLPALDNWASILFGQGFWTGAFIGWDIVTGFFSDHFLKWLSRHFALARLILL